MNQLIYQIILIRSSESGLDALAVCFPSIEEYFLPSNPRLRTNISGGNSQVGEWKLNREAQNLMIWQILVNTGDCSLGT